MIKLIALAALVVLPKVQTMDVSLSFELIPTAGVDVKDTGEFYAWNGATGEYATGVLNETSSQRIEIAGVTITREADYAIAKREIPSDHIGKYCRAYRDRKAAKTGGSDCLRQGRPIARLKEKAKTR